MSTKEIVSHENTDMITPEELYKEFYPSNQFVKNILNKQPNGSIIATNKHANNSRYLPIGEIEMQLDELFCGLWQTKNFTYSVVANEIVCSIELWVYHPILKDWIVRNGVGAAMIQQEGYKKDEQGNYVLGSGGKRIKISPLPSDVDFKIKNTLVKDFPHAKAEALKNAAKSLGKYFGRDLNRGDKGGTFDDSLGSISKSASKKPLDDNHFQSALELVKDGIKSAESLKRMFALTTDQINKLDEASK